MVESTEFAVLDVPPRIANLAFRLSAPRAWNLHDLPVEDVDFSVPTSFFPLVLLTAPFTAVALTVAARPGFENGALQDWSLFLLSALDIRPTAFAPVMIGNVPGLAGVGRQHQEGSWLEVRFAFFEDGGRLVYLGLLAPEAISAPLEPVWHKALGSFDLAESQGPTVPVGEGMGVMPERAAKPEPAEPPAEPAPAEPAVALAAEPSPAAREFADTDLGFYAKSADTATLDPEHPINARLRDQGVGFAPHVLATDLVAKTAQLGAGAIQALIRVALGWHVNDDGRRTLLLDPEGKIQIHLSLIVTQGRNAGEIIDALQAEVEESYASPEFRRLEQDGMWGLAVRNIAVNSEPIEQTHLLTRWRKGSAMLRARITSDPASTRFAVDYADLILRSAEYGADDEYDGEDEPVAEPEPARPAPVKRESGGDDWRARYKQLEREDRLAEAEQLVRDTYDNIYCAIQIAHMYRDRWLRLKESDPAKAAEARAKAEEWAYTYASWATSGGEGAALSRERDEFLKTLE